MSSQKRIIQISFKNTIEEELLYNWLLSKLSPSHYIKEELWHIYNNMPTFYTQDDQSLNIDNQMMRTNDTCSAPKDEYCEFIERKIAF